jgi:hypothetical protein
MQVAIEALDPKKHAAITVIDLELAAGMPDRKNHFILVYRALRWNNSRDRPVV